MMAGVETIPRTTKSTSTDAQQEQNRGKEDSKLNLNSEREKITNGNRLWLH